jgi:hypothetical protein
MARGMGERTRHPVIKRTMRWFNLIVVLVFVHAIDLAVAPAQDRMPAELYMLHVTATDAAARPLPGAEIRLDDEVAGITDITGQYYLARKPLPDGSHSVTASFPGFVTTSRTVARLSEISQSKTGRGVDLTLKLPKLRRPADVEVDRGAEPPRPNYDVVPVFYVTDREDTGNQNPVLRYSGERSRAATIAYGICEVTIPSTHVPGELESPSWLHFEYNPDPDKHVVLRSVQPLERDPFYVKLAAAVANSPKKEAVVFIHGYQNSFEHAARQKGKRRWRWRNRSGAAGE